MHIFSSVFLAVAVSAVDIRLHINTNCAGPDPYAACANINPNTCCGVDRRDLQSVRFAAIPQDWRLGYRGHNGGHCNGLRESQVQGNVRDWCLKIGPFSGGGYWFASKKRDVAPDFSMGECQRPDKFVLEEGVNELNITGFSDEAINQLFDLAMDGKEHSVIQARYAELSTL